jgi:PAS domain S-box-containing protein
MAENQKPRKSTRLYKELFHHLETGLVILRLENRDDPRSLRLIGANPAARRAAAVAVEDYEGKLLADTAPKLFETGIPQACAEVVRSGQTRDLGEIQLGDKGITGAIFAVKAHPLHDDCAAVVFKDVTEQKRADEARREYEKLVEASEAMIAVVDRDYRYLLTNRAFLEHRNLGREQVMGRSVSEVLGKEVFEGVVKKNLDACFQGEAIQYEMKYAYPDLGERNLLVSYVPIKGPAGIDRVGSAIHDITEQRRAEEALKASEQRYRELFENATDIVFTCDLQGNFTSINKAGEQSSGYTRAELTRMNVLQFLAPEYVEEGRRVLEGLAAGREPGIGEWEVVAKDGHRVWLEAGLRLVRRNGELAEVQGIARDITERKRAEDELRQSEQFNREVIASARDGVVVYDREFRYRVWNRFLEELTGLPASQILGKQGYDLFPHWREQKVEALLQRALGGEVVHSPDMPFRVPLTGKSGWVSGVFSPHFGPNGEIIGVIGIVRDIAERKRADEALAESEERFRSLVENVTVGIYRTTPEGRIVMANPTLVRMLGYDSFEELASRNLELEGFASGYPRSAFREQVEREGEAKGFESAWERRDGSVVLVRESARAVRAGDGRVLYYDGIVEDVTERRRAEEALKESETRFRAVFENAASGIALVDMHGHPVESNPSLQKMLGYSARELTQMAFSEFTHPDDVQASWDLFAELVEGKRDRYQLDKRFCRKDGRIVWGQLTESLVRNQNGEPEYAIGMVEDISERKQAEEALRQLSGQLLRMQDEERRRIARELHDTTAQSLAALAINLSVVKDSVPDLSPRARTCLSESLELVKECSREIRTLSYLLHPPLLDEAGLGSALRWFVDGYTQRTGIHVDLEMPRNFTRLPVYIELALYRVVQEGLTNIHHHSGSKGAHICLSCGPDQAELTVTDEGRGIPPGLLERGGRHGAKLGVGIPGMRERIRQLGGQFEIVSGNNGTTLTAIVPLREEQA